MNFINFNEARKIANEAARRQWKNKADNSILDFLSSDFLEAEGCWFFFICPEFDKPLLPGDLSVNKVYAVTMSEKCNLVYDFRENSEKMADYLHFYSTHALFKKEEADKLIRDFLIKYQYI